MLLGRIEISQVILKTSGNAAEAKNKTFACCPTTAFHRNREILACEITR